MSLSGKAGRAEILALTLMLLLGLAQGLLYQYYYVDDSFISLRYLDNLLAGHGLSFNPGDSVEGYSCFAWIVLLAPFALVLKAAGVAFPDTFWLARVLGLFAGLATLIILWRLSRSVFGPERKWAALVPPGWLAVSIPFWVWSSSGMETPLFAFLITLTLHRYLIEARDPEARPWSAFALVLASLTRPEGPLYLIALALHAGWRNRKILSDGRFRGWLMLFAVLYGTYFIWRIIHFGHLLPTSVIAKAPADPIQAVSGGIGYLNYFFEEQGGLVLYLPALIALGSREFSARARPALALIAAAFVLILTSGGDWMFYWRFVVPVLPALILTAVMGYDLLVRSLLGRFETPLIGPRRHRPPRVAAAVLAVLVVVQMNLSHPKVRRDDLMYDYARTWTTWAPRPYRLGFFLHTAWLTPVRDISVRLARDTTPLATWIGAANAVADWIERNTGDSAVIATTVAGYVPYRTGRTTVDMLGLNDRQIARLFSSGRHDELVDRVYGIKPDVVILIVMPETADAAGTGELRLTDTIQEKFYIDPRFQETYGPSFRMGHYLVYSLKGGRY